MKIEDKIGEFCGELKFVTDDGTEFSLKPRLEHKRKLMFIQKKFDNNEYTEEDIKSQDDIVLGILKEAYPNFMPNQVEHIVQLYGTEILVEFYCAWKWRDRSTIEAFKEKQKKEIRKLLDGTQ